MTRRFRARQRLVLRLRSGGRCEECRNPLPASFHADHELPFSAGGPTVLFNARATCPACNLKKGNKTMKLRDWQEAARAKALNYYQAADGERHFVINAAPGAGKTRVSCTIARDLLELGMISRVVVIAPRRAVVDQWAKEFQRTTGRHMMKITASDDLGPLHSDICATWAAVKDLQDVFQAICGADDVLVICDEHHHAAIKAAWGTSADSAFQDARFSLILTGTPTRSDGTRSVWLDLDELGDLKHPEDGMYTLTYGQAVELNYCRPVVFHRHRGLFTVDLDNGHEIEVSSDGPPVLPENLTVNAAIRRVVDFHRLARTPQYEADRKTPKMTGYQASMMACASEKLDEIRLELPEAGGLVIAHDITMANYFARVIERLEGEPPLVVHSGVPTPDRRIDAFRATHRVRWLVAVGMVSEGVDIQRLRVLVYLPHPMTELAFRQAIGRVVRNAGPDDHSRAYVVMPALEQFDEFARRIEEDMPPAGLRDDVSRRDKRCMVCGARSAVSATDCVECGADFPARQVSFTTCSCGAKNRITENHCLNCGEDLVGTYRITLASAARDGLIARGVDLSEQAACEAEAMAPAHRALLRRVEASNKALAKMLRTFPVEMLPQLAKLFRDEDYISEC